MSPHTGETQNKGFNLPYRDAITVPTPEGPCTRTEEEWSCAGVSRSRSDSKQERTRCLKTLHHGIESKGQEEVKMRVGDTTKETHSTGAGHKKGGGGGKRSLNSSWPEECSGERGSSTSDRIRHGNRIDTSTDGDTCPHCPRSRCWPTC